MTIMTIRTISEDVDAKYGSQMWLPSSGLELSHHKRNRGEPELLHVRYMGQSNG